MKNINQFNMKYSIKDNYKYRSEEIYYDDRSGTDSWQKEVYEYALSFSRKIDLKKIFDFGCGSAYKLLKYFGKYDTIGADISPTYDWLVNNHPDRRWIKASFDVPFNDQIDLVICADVIEHLKDPDLLLKYIELLDCKYIILSTPDRNDPKLSQDGPPHNPAHIREWTFQEFNLYISQTFEVLEHFISNQEQSTQCVLCRKRLG